MDVEQTVRRSGSELQGGGVLALALLLAWPAVAQTPPSPRGELETAVREHVRVGSTSRAVASGLRRRPGRDLAGASYGSGTALAPSVAEPSPCGEGLGPGASEAGVDLGSFGFSLSLLPAPFQLQELAVRRDCPTGFGQYPLPEDVEDPQLGASSSYRIGDNGFAFVYQVEWPDPLPAVIDLGRATFWSDGYAYDVTGFRSVLEQQVYGGGEGVWDFEDGLAALAPDLSAQCFARRVAGSWSDLGAQGIGDPRPAVQGLAEDYFSLLYLEPAPSTCGLPEPDPRLQFDAGFSAADGTRVSMLVHSQPGIPASLPTKSYGDMRWTLPGVEILAAVIDPSGAPTPASEARLQALALALDPSVDLACVAEERHLSPEESVSFGLPSANAPPGFSLTYETLLASVFPDGCSQASGVRSYSLDWHFARSVPPDQAGDGLELIDAYAFRNPNTSFPRDDQFTADGYLWTGPDGTQFNVYAYDALGFPLSRDVLDFVARSLDPSVVLPGD